MTSVFETLEYIQASQSVERTRSIIYFLKSIHNFIWEKLLGQHMDN